MNKMNPAGSFVWALALAILLAGCAAGGTGGAKLQLADEGSFFVNGQSYRSEHPGASLNTGPAPAGNITINQMYVHYRIPAERKGVPILMVHGSQHTCLLYTSPSPRD